MLVISTNSHCTAVSGTIEKAICSGGTRPTSNINVKRPKKLKLKNLFAKILIDNILLFVLQFTACNICIRQIARNAEVDATSFP